MAFQGGGVKGLSYIGAYKALRDMHPHLIIKSVIGASAGSIIALAISTGVTPERLTEFFKELDKMSTDVTLKRVSDITPQKDKQYQ